MKRIHIFLSCALVLLALSLTLAFKGNEAPKTAEAIEADALGAEAAEMYAVGSYKRHPFTADTITNSEDDTIALPSSWGAILSRYIYCYSVVKTSLSGTLNAAVLLQESNLSSGNTDWSTIDSLSGGATGTIGRCVGDEIYGIRHRLIVQGRGGTQSTRYALQVTLKKK